MPYAEPTSPSPLPSPAKEHPHPSSTRKGHYTPPSHIEVAGPSTKFDSSSSAMGPMPGIPRRSSANSSGASTPRRGLSPAVSRQTSASYTFPSSRPMEGLPRRGSSGQGLPTMDVPGLPTNGEGSTLGLKLLPSPVKTSPQRVAKDSMDSTSTMESALISTPPDETADLPSTNGHALNGKPIPIPFILHEPPPKTAMPSRSAMSPTRPTLINSRRGSGPIMGHRRGDHTGSLQIPFPSSSSTTQLPSPTPSSQLSTSPSFLRPASMIRKKSGEVVKPSLKQRSMSTPDLSRQPDHSDPATPGHESDRGFPEERSKSVRFAGAEDDSTALENVVLFLREQKPTAVGKAADPDRAGLPSDTDNTDLDTELDSDYVSFRTRRNAAARAADEAERLQLEGCSRVPRLRVDFAPDARGSLKGEHVVLERVELQSTTGPLTLKGTAIVRNVAFQKWVAIRFTLDGWQTVSEVSGTHVGHIPAATTGDEGWDRFSFSIKLEDIKRKLEERQLLLCIRFSVDGREWWDSNNGDNYNFTFKKAPPRRPARASAPASFGGGFMRLNEATVSTLPGLRQNRATSPSSQISRAFGASSEHRPTGPRNWVFPKLAATIVDGPPRPDSPISRAPPASFKAPNPPDVHTHLSLSRYCAPSPPQSPPKEQVYVIPPAVPTPLVLSPEADGHSSPNQPMNVFGGQFATLDVPSPDADAPAHERRRSWSGKSDSWESFSQAMGHAVEEAVQTTDGDATPIAVGSRSPLIGHDSGDSSPEQRSRPLAARPSSVDLQALVAARPSSGNLQALVTDDAGLITPPSSNLSSPPSPAGQLPGSMSPSLSTGESSPINTLSTESTPDLSAFPLQIDPDEHRGRPGFPANSYKMLSNSYQEFLDKFCFFQSPTMTPVEEPVYHRPPMFIPLSSGTSSPAGYPFFASNSSNSPRSTPTPTKQYDSASDAFNFSPVPMPAVPGLSGKSSSTSISPSASARGMATPSAKSSQQTTPTPPQVGSPPRSQFPTGFPSPSPGHAWATDFDKASPTLTAAQ